MKALLECGQQAPCIQTIRPIAELLYNSIARTSKITILTNVKTVILAHHGTLPFQKPEPLDTITTQNLPTLEKLLLNKKIKPTRPFLKTPSAGFLKSRVSLHIQEY